MEYPFLARYGDPDCGCFQEYECALPDSLKPGIDVISEGSSYFVVEIRGHKVQGFSLNTNINTET